jgi:hypothetical protein
MNTQDLNGGELLFFMYVICYIHKWDRQIISVYNLRYVYILFMYIQCGFLCLKVH